MARYRLAIEEMSDGQLIGHLERISMELANPSADWSWCARRRRIPEELLQVAAALRHRGVQMQLGGELVPRAYPVD